VNSFDWQGFYDRFGGGAFLEEMKRVVKQRYDYVLVDSRTGVSDTAGICTLQLPDTLVVCFTLNNQSIEGAAAVTNSVYEQRARTKPIRVLPVPMRVENSEKAKLELRKAYARRCFAQFPTASSGLDADGYWADVEVLYVPFYAYEETLATFRRSVRGTRHYPCLGRAACGASDRRRGEEGPPAERGKTPRGARRVRGPDAADTRRRQRTPRADHLRLVPRDDAAGAAGRLYDALSER